MSIALLYRPRSRGWVVVALAVLLSGCWSTPEATVQPRNGRAGLQLAGSVSGRQLAVSDGAPRLVVGDCDPDVSGDADVCVIAEDIGGELVVVVIENPGALRAPATLKVADPGCGAECDDVTAVAVVDLQLGTGRRQRATDGHLQVRELTPFTRYAGELRLAFDSASVSGSFDLVPRAD